MNSFAFLLPPASELLAGCAPLPELDGHATRVVVVGHLLDHVREHPGAAGAARTFLATQVGSLYAALFEAEWASTQREREREREALASRAPADAAVRSATLRGRRRT